MLYEVITILSFAKQFTLKFPIESVNTVTLLLNTVTSALTMAIFRNNFV